MKDGRTSGTHGPHRKQSRHALPAAGSGNTERTRHPAYEEGQGLANKRKHKIQVWFKPLGQIASGSSNSNHQEDPARNMELRNPDALFGASASANPIVPAC